MDGDPLAGVMPGWRVLQGVEAGSAEVLVGVVGIGHSGFGMANSTSPVELAYRSGSAAGSNRLLHASLKGSYEQQHMRPELQLKDLGLTAPLKHTLHCLKTPADDEAVYAYGSCTLISDP